MGGYFYLPKIWNSYYTTKWKYILSSNKYLLIRPFQKLVNRKNKNAPKEDRNLEFFLPPSFIPYFQLCRISRPTGNLLIWLPSTWSITLAHPAGNLPDPYLLGLFGVGAVLMRAAGCIINDILDKDLDKLVARSSNRPLVAGTINNWHTFIFLSGILGLALKVLLQLNWYSVLLGVCSLALVITYPLLKRFTYWPQLGLGLASNWGILIGYAAVQGHCCWFTCIPLFISAVCWTLIYDTIYAHQDYADDLKAGVKSTALLFGEKTYNFLYVTYLIMYINLISVGVISNLSWPFYVFLLVSSIYNTYLVYDLNIYSNSDCASNFQKQPIFGIIIFLGILCGNYLR